MAKDFSVNKFKSSFQNGLTDQSLFEFKFTGLPPCLRKIHLTSIIDNLTIHTKKAQMPDMTIQTNPVAYTGAPSKYPYEHSSSDMGIEVVSSANLWERKFFWDWQQKIVDYGIPGSGNNGANFLVGYYNDYVVNGELSIYNKKGDLMSTLVIANCWPMSIGVMDLDWSTKDTVAVFYVTLGFSYWEFKEGKK